MCKAATCPLRVQSAYIEGSTYCNNCLHAMLCDENSAACGGSLGLWGGEAICFVENSVDSRRDFTLSSLPECAPPPSAPPPEDPCTVACAVEDPDGGIIGIVGIVVGVLALVVLSVLLFLWLTGAACFNKADGRHPPESQGRTLQSEWHSGSRVRGKREEPAPGSLLGTLL